MFGWARLITLSYLTLGFSAIACDPVEDRVFDSVSVKLDIANISVAEDSGIIQLSVPLKSPAPDAVAATYSVTGVTAQEDCHVPDFQATDGRVEWSQGQSEANIEVWIRDDEFAETDETIEISFHDFSGVRLEGPSTITVVIEDNDRTDLIDAQEQFGLTPGRSEDQSEALQEALDAAEQSGRGVVVVSPGTYTILGVSVAPGTTLSGRGAYFERPAQAPETAVTLDVLHSGDTDSLPTLIEGVTIDGHREDQGPYQDFERENAHLIAVAGDIQQPGRVSIDVNSVTLRSGTGDGLAIGPNSDATACDIVADNIWREAVSVHGGNTDLRLRRLTANATFGTSGMWLDGYTQGFDGSVTVNIEMEDIELATGDLAIELGANSTVSFDRLFMTQPPFHMDARDSTVRIRESVLYLGVPSTRHNFWALPHDVEVTDSILFASEAVDQLEQIHEETEEADRTFAIVEVHNRAEPPRDNTPLESTDSHLVFDNCSFQVADNVEDTDEVYALQTVGPQANVIVRNSTLGPRMTDWAHESCDTCTVE